MSKIRLKWLWCTIGLEIAVITGLLLWAFFVRQPETPKPAPTTTKQQSKPPRTLKTPVIKLVEIFKGFSKPVAIVANDWAEDRRIYVVEQEGKIYTVTDDGTKSADPFLDISNKVKNGLEMGLLGLVFHPNFNQRPYLYINYVDTAQNTIVARYTMSRDTLRADMGSAKILLKIKQPYVNHNGGNMLFGPDGYLYIGMGDGGYSGDPGNRAQNKNNLLGKMLRIDVDSGNPYAVPANNPYVEGDGKPEIWASGLRNPWRFSFDRKTGDLYIADVGQGKLEEINFQPASSKGGENYGWRCYEGSQLFNPEDCQSADAYVKPVIQYDHGDERCSVTGGYVYRGSDYPALGGQYFFGDFCNGQLFYAKQTDDAWKTVLGTDTELKISTFGQDKNGELFLADYATGTIYQITDSAN